MDTSKHTVNIPYDDYVRMTKAESILTKYEGNLNLHLDMMKAKLKLEFDIDISSAPTSVRKQFGMFGKDAIIFEYGKTN